MKPGFVSAVAMLFCCAIFAIVALFGYSRYEAAQSENAAFRVQLQTSADQQAALAAHMPGQLPPRASTAGGGESPSPQPAGQ
jgi:type II secretory pathway component PulJ